TSDCLVFVSERQKNYWLRRGMLGRRNVAIHNGVDLERFNCSWDAVERAEVRARLGFTGTDYVIGIAALLRPEKTPLELLDAVARLHALGVRAKALLIGDGEMRSAIEARAERLKIAGDVVVTGVQKDVRPYVRACDVMLLCSFTEAFSLAAVEA